MVEQLRKLIDRWPETEEAIRALLKTDIVFDALCQDYRQTSDQLRRLERSNDSTAVARKSSLVPRQSLGWIRSGALITRCRRFGVASAALGLTVLLFGAALCSLRVWTVAGSEMQENAN